MSISEVRCERRSDAPNYTKEPCSPPARVRRAPYHETLYARGFIAQHQYKAASRLLSDFELTQRSLTTASPWRARVDQSGGAGSAHPSLGAQRRYAIALNVLPTPARAVVEAVVIREETLEVAAGLPAIVALVPGWSERRRAIAAMGFLGHALNELARHYAQVDCSPAYRDGR